MNMKSELLGRCEIAREDAELFMHRIYSLAQVVAVASRTPDAQSDVSVEALGVANEVIAEDIKRVEEILDRYLNELREVEGK